MNIGTTLYLWRNKRGLSQAQLAEKAGLPRPNYSDIERGHRDLTLSTLRSLALALNVRPGILADGKSPDRKPSSLSRESLENIARYASTGSDNPNLSFSEKRIAKLLSILLQSRLGKLKKRSHTRNQKRKIEFAWIRLRSILPSNEIESLIARVPQ